MIEPSIDQLDLSRSLCGEINFPVQEQKMFY